MIEARGLTKRFGTIEVLRGVDLRIVRGRVTAIVGPNGAGKTTFIKAVLGLTRADAGTLTFDGTLIGDDESYRARIGYMPQIARFPEHLTATELLQLLRDLRGTDAVNERLIEPFGLQPELRKKLSVLSGGTRQKVNAVAAFLFSPELYVLDEPTAGLDPVSSGILKARILRERDEGRTVLLTSHIMSEIDELADDVIYLTDGRVQYTGAVAGLKSAMGHQNLERAVAELMLRKAAA
ncbi:MAG: ABC transporter ATP-binding protein [Gemmatimonadaceae bacterium]